MLHSDVNSLGNNSLSDLFIDDNSNGPGVYVEDSAGSSVIVLIGHAFVDGSINHNVNDISDLVGGQSLRDVDSTMLFKSLFKFVSGSAFVSVAVSHLWMVIKK